VYSLGVSEEILGRALKDFGPGRDRVVIATKVFNAMGDDPNQRGLSRKHIMHGIDASLRRLGCDYVDLYQIHRFDYETPIEETLEALNDVVRAGKALYIGASSMYAWQFAKMLNTSDRLGLARFVTMQNHYNLIYREEEREMIPLCREEGIGLIPWSPLARGFLAGNRTKQDFGETSRAKTDDYAQRLYYQDSDFEIVDRVSAIAKRRGVSNAQIALAWILAQPGVTSPIIGASKMRHLDEAVAALSLRLDESELQELGDAYRPHRVLGHS
jgi:aryl-alcohol dehydrogenase (NADP+)